jgi:tetratricopeptide (TPR) repeat protein
MSKTLVYVVAAAALALGSYSVVSMAADGKPTVSKVAAKTLKAAQEAQTAKKYADVVSKTQEALALPGKTPYDAYVANQMLGFAYIRLGNIAEAAKAFEAALDLGFAAPAEQNTLTKALASAAYQQKNYAKAADFGLRLIRAGAGDGDTYTLVAQAYFLQDKYKEAARFLGEYVSDVEKRGQTPREQSLQLISESYQKIGDTAAATNMLEKMVVYYPKPNYWNNLLYTLMRTEGNSDRHILNIYRLMQDTGTLKNPSDYTEMAQLALEQGTPGEAKAVLEQAIAASVFTEQRDKDRNARLLESAKKAAAADLASLPKFEIEAKAAKTGEPDVALGRGYLSHGMNDKAAEAIARGIAKGSLKYPDESQILLGVAQLRLKNSAEAIKSFRAVKTADARYQRIAKLWVLHAS